MQVGRAQKLRSTGFPDHKQLRDPSGPAAARGEWFGLATPRVHQGAASVKVAGAIHIRKMSFNWVSSQFECLMEEKEGGESEGQGRHP